MHPGLLNGLFETDQSLAGGAVVDVAFEFAGTLAGEVAVAVLPEQLGFSFGNLLAVGVLDQHPAEAAGTHQCFTRLLVGDAEVFCDLLAVIAASGHEQHALFEVGERCDRGNE